MTTLHRRLAHRYELDVPLRHRWPGGTGWRPGRTVNASRTGVLFQVQGDGYAPGTPLELQLELGAGGHGSMILCTGSVVRCEPSPGGSTRIAATIDMYHFGPHEDTENASLSAV